jgi:hypothetical protein
MNPPGKQAHHVIPQAVEEQARRAGINIHDPKYGSWWETGIHQSKSAEYGKKWKRFFDEKPSATAAEILQFARDRAKEYGLKIYF